MFLPSILVGDTKVEFGSYSNLWTLFSFLLGIPMDASKKSNSPNWVPEPKSSIGKNKRNAVFWQFVDKEHEPEERITG